MNEFLKALRPETILASVLGFAVAAALSFLDHGPPRPSLAGAALAGLVSLHLSLNLIFQAANPEEGPGRPGSVQKESHSARLLRQWTLLGSALALFMVALALGFWLAEQDRPLVFMWGFGGITAALVYTFISPRMRRLGLGQLALLLGFGPLPTLGSYYALTGRAALAPALMGIPQALLLVALMWTGPLRPRLWDNKKTGAKSPGRPEPEQAGPNRWTHLGLVALALASLVLLLFTTRAGLLVLMGLAVAPLGLGAALDLGKGDPEALKRSQTRTVLAFVGLALLLSVGLLGERFLRI